MGNPKCYVSAISLPFLLVCQFCLSFQSVAQKMSRIDCFLPNTRDSIECKLIINRLEEAPLINSTIVLDGHAIFVVNLDEPCPAYIWIENRKEDVTFFIDSPDIRLTVDSLLTAPIRISGSPATQVWNQQDSTLKLLSKKHTALQEGYNTGFWVNDSLSNRFEQFERVADSLQTLYLARLTNLIVEHPKASSSWYLFAANFPALPYSTRTELLPILAGFADYPSYQKIQRLLSHNKMGQPITDFVLPTLTASPLRLSSLKNRYILLDFSSSYLTSSKRRHRSLKRLYSLYHSAGLEIVTISREFDKQATQAALSEEKLPWPVVVDTEGISVSTYQMARIPNLILLDRHKRIIYRDGTLQDLKAKLEKLLKQ